MSNDKRTLQRGSIVRDTHSDQEGYVVRVGYAQGVDGQMYLEAKVIWGKGGYENWAPASRLEVVQ